MSAPGLSLYAVKLLHIPGAGHRMAHEILNDLQERNIPVDDTLLADLVSAKLKKGIPTDAACELFRKAEDVYHASLQRGIRFTNIFDHDYPNHLRRLRYPPTVLSYAGDISFCNHLITVTLSGTRHPTPHGYAISMRLGELFGTRNFVVVAGLAAGCGTAAHSGCLKAKGKTMAIVAHGLAHVYPAENAPLAKQIIESGGAIVSARFLNERPRKAFFVERNFIQGGICDFMVITQTRAGSGVRHIVNAAKYCGNPVYIYDPPAKYTDPAFVENKSLIHCNVGLPIASRKDIDHCMNAWRR